MRKKEFSIDQIKEMIRMYQEEKMGTPAIGKSKCTQGNIKTR
jgi:hypothetical protein